MRSNKRNKDKGLPLNKAVNGSVKLVPTTFEWSDAIDVKRAEAAEERARKMIARKDASAVVLKMAEARLKRALVRKSVAEM